MVINLKIGRISVNNHLVPAARHILTGAPSAIPANNPVITANQELLLRVSTTGCLCPLGKKQQNKIEDPARVRRSSTLR